MNIEQVRDFTLSLHGVTEDQPFGDDKCDVCGSASRFACKLQPDRNEELRDRYDAVPPAFHWNKKHWSDIYYEQLDADLVTALITESYRLIVSKLPKAVRVKYESY